MGENSKRIGPCRYLASAKPVRKRPLPAFLRCPVCGSILCDFLGGANIPSCCGAEMERLSPLSSEGMFESKALYFDIVGGFNENCLRVYWTGEAPRWLYLDTFSGGQYMEIGAKRRPPAVFALAGEDAYAYCDKDPCQMCSFRCKNGFMLYACYENEIFEMPVNRIAATSGSPESMTN